MINTGGENVSSREVEEAIYAHPEVSEVAVVGAPGPEVDRGRRAPSSSGARARRSAPRS